MTELEQATVNLRMAHEAKQAMIDRVVADAERQFAYIIELRNREYHDALRRAISERHE